MDFEWDEGKSDACFEARGFDFSYATAVFTDLHRLISKDERNSYGEDRYSVIGCIDKRLFVVIFTMRLGVTRIISARKANQREVKYYENHPHDD
jgi:uncharacterized DUF497 family protein